MGIQDDLDLIKVAFDEPARREALEAARRLHRQAAEVEKVHEKLEAASGALVEARTVTSSDPETGIRQLMAEREQLQEVIARLHADLGAASTVAEISKAALVSLTSEDHPWYLPGQPDGEDYHCFRCRALNELEVWRKTPRDI